MVITKFYKSTFFNFTNFWILLLLYIYKFDYPIYNFLEIINQWGLFDVKGGK